MNKYIDIDYGPLQALIGVWVGKDGLDIAPEEDGVERNDYYETITFTPIGAVTNAEKQNLVAIHYHQEVNRSSNDKPIHDETGYWMWDATAGVLMHSLLIPRGVSVIAGGNHDGSLNPDGSITLEVSAAIDDDSWKIIQSPFMLENAKTIEFSHSITVGNDSLSYKETTMVDIYGEIFEHTDENSLIRKA